jgi:hypothetical protein
VFSLADASVWSADDVILKIQEILPTGWDFSQVLDYSGYHVTVKDGSGAVWDNSGPDAKTLFLACLSWLHLRGKQTVNPAWKPRTSEVSLYRPSVSSGSVPLDLDPDEVESVYKTSR